MEVITFLKTSLVNTIINIQNKNLWSELELNVILIFYINFLEFSEAFLLMGLCYMFMLHVCLLPTVEESRVCF